MPYPAPIQPCAVRMATEMQENIQPLIQRWRARGYVIGFGVGLAFGAATVGQIGTGSRLEYTAIGNVVNWPPGCARRLQTAKSCSTSPSRGRLAPRCRRLRLGRDR